MHRSYPGLGQGAPGTDVSHALGTAAPEYGNDSHRCPFLPLSLGVYSAARRLPERLSDYSPLPSSYRLSITLLARRCDARS